MTPNQALALAIRALQKDKQRIAIDAHAAKWHGMTYPHAVESAARYDQIEEAIQLLTNMKSITRQDLTSLPLFVTKQ